MKIKPTHLLSLRLPVSELKEYEKLVDEKKFHSVSEALRDCGIKGRLLLDYKEVLSDPQQRKEFFEKLDSKLNEKMIFEWVRSLNDVQMRGISQAIQIEQEKRQS